MTRYVALLGFPLKHSISPTFQQKALDFYGLDIRYSAWEVTPDDLRSALNLLRQPQYLGANVTIPYKETILTYMDNLSEEAQAIGAVNTIVTEGGRLKGYNTDAQGFLRALMEAGFEPQGKRVVILGAGGGAKAAVYALVRSEASYIAIFNRTHLRGVELVQKLNSLLREGQEIKALPWEEEGLKEALNSCHLLINATPLGMRHSPFEDQLPLRVELIPQHALIYDLVYNPIETPLIQKAKEKGAQTMNGLAMLVYQGALSFELWTGKQAPLEIIFETARRALEV